MKVLKKYDGELPLYILIAKQYSVRIPGVEWSFQASFEDGLKLHLATSDPEAAKHLRDEIEAEGMVLDGEGKTMIVYRRQDAPPIVIPEYFA